MELLGLPLVLLHGSVGIWDEVAYVTAAALGVAAFVAVLLAKIRKSEK